MISRPSWVFWSDDVPILVGSFVPAMPCPQAPRRQRCGEGPYRRWRLKDRILTVEGVSAVRTPPRQQTRARTEYLRELSRSSDERNDRQNQKDHKKDFRDPGGGSGNPAKAEEGSNEGDDEKNNGVLKHMG